MFSTDELRFTSNECVLPKTCVQRMRSAHMDYRWLVPIIRPYDGGRFADYRDPLTDILLTFFFFFFAAAIVRICVRLSVLSRKLV